MTLGYRLREHLRDRLLSVGESERESEWNTKIKIHSMTKMK